jgi:multisubunit Na+/H+ antiporter MnhG subunit
MNKPIVIIGSLVLIIGVVLIAVGAVGVLRGLTVISTFNQPQSGEYVSTELMLNATSGIAVTSAAANGGLILAQYLSLVNSTNIGQYAVTPHSNVAGTVTYTNLIGDYYYVAFTSSQPSSKVVATPLHGGTMASSPVVLGGFLAVIVGIAVIVVGALRKSNRSKSQRKKDGEEKEEEERRTNSNVQTNPAGR